MINVKLGIGTFATLLAGLYCTHSGIDVLAVPTSLYIELVEQLTPYLKVWDYEKISFEDWVKYNLIIAPKEMFEDSELEDCKNNAIYIERKIGNVVLVATADV